MNVVYTDAHCPCHLHVVRTCTHHLLVISNTPCIPYYPQLSFCTLSTHTHTHCPCHLYVVCTCTCHMLVISNAPCIPYYPKLSFRTLSTHTHIVNVICILFTDIWMTSALSVRKEYIKDHCK